MEESITKKFKILTIIAGILTLIPVLSIIYNLFGVTNEKLYTISFYGLKIIGLVIYIFISKKIKVRRIIYVVLAILSLLVSILMVNSMSGVSGGLDALGEALAYALLVKFSLYSYYIVAFLLYMSYAKKFIFKKNAIIRAVIVLLLALAVYGIIQLIKVDRVKEDLLPTVGDFKNELASRGLCNGECYTSDSIKLYGIKKGLEKADDLDFYSDSNKKYPLYVYATEETLHETNWLIYYINGNLYAVSGYYYSSGPSSTGEEHKVIISYPNIVVSESNKVVTYNYKSNVFKESEYLWGDDFRYYSKGNGASIFIDLPEATSKNHNFYTIDVVNRLDKEALENIDLDNRSYMY